MLDLLNLLYVSMTRAEERLYILTKPPPKKQDEVSSLPGFFRLFLQQENLWDEARGRYEFGTMTAHAGKTGRNGKTAIIPGGIISADWRRKVEIRLRASQAWDIENPLQSSQWGTRIHTVLSWVITEKDIPAAIEKAILKGLLDVGEAEMAREILRSVVADPKLSGLFSDRVKVKTEAEILLPKGSFYRPDRVVFDNQTVTVIDYKTGKPLSSHGEQLIKYAGYLEEMGYKDIRRLLVYLGPELKVAEA
jgi:ATP-dependent exoDNAse (exonuclease V) beta subunit